MKEIQLTKDKVAIVDDDDYEWLMVNSWYYHDDLRRNSGYAIRAGGPRKSKKIFMHRVINQTPDGYFTDHINGNKLDNRKENLRTCTLHQN